MAGLLNGITPEHKRIQTNEYKNERSADNKVSSRGVNLNFIKAHAGNAVSCRGQNC